MTPPPDSVRFDEYAGSYDADLGRGLALSGESRAYFAERRVRFVARYLTTRGRSVRRVLDFGCGDGSTAPLLQAELGAAAVLGVDASDALLAAARVAHGSATIAFQTVAEHRPTAEFDLAFCNGVFHHIPPADRVEVARSVYHSLAPGAVFAFWENNPWNPGTRWVMRRIPFDRDAIPIPPPEGRRLLQEAGFAIDRTAYLFIFPRLFRWLRPLERYLEATPVGAQYVVLAHRPSQ